jgi:hypothetical protein
MTYCGCLTVMLLNGLFHRVCYVMLLLLEPLFHFFLLLLKGSLQLLLDRLVERSARRRTSCRHACWSAGCVARWTRRNEGTTHCGPFSFSPHHKYKYKCKYLHTQESLVSFSEKVLKQKLAF